MTVRRSGLLWAQALLGATLCLALGAPVPAVARFADDKASEETAQEKVDISGLPWNQVERYDRFPRERGYNDLYDALREHANQSYEGVSETDSREIVCWGDSMTEGVGAGLATIKKGGQKNNISFKAYPQILQELTGLKTFNFGIAGATSEEIALMQGALSIEELRSPLEVFLPRIAHEGEQHPGDILILEIGSNGGWANRYKRLIKQYRAMIEHSGCKDYLIIGDTDDPGTSIADLRQQPFAPGTGPGETAWEAALRKEFGDHFINMRVYLIEHGLDVCGLKRNRADRAMADKGCISTKLRYDWTHFNSYGYYAQAYGIYERGLELGYWGPDALPLEELLTPRN